MHSALSLIWPIALPGLRNAFRAFWSHECHVSCVVSLVPMLNGVFAETLPPSVPLFTVLTDFSHTSSHPWIQHPRQHLIVGTDIAYAQALAEGYLPVGVPGPSQLVTRTPGMVVHPKFYVNAPSDVRERRALEMGLHPTLPTVLVLFGGAPPTNTVVELVNRFVARQTYSPVNLIVVCARNKVLYDKIMRRKARNPRQCMFVTGFSTEIPLFMQMADVLIGKPGPGVVSEACVSRVPCVLLTGAAGENVMKQEKDVLDWVRREKIGLVVRSPQDAAKITVSQMAEMKERVTSRPENDAVFQVGEMILNAMGLQVSKSDNDTAQDVNKPPEADIADMDLGAEVPSVVATRGTRRSSAPAHGRYDVEASDAAQGVGSRREGRANSLSPTTITALPPRATDGDTPQPLPSSRASYTLRKKVDEPSQAAERVA
eukprot:GFKZ01014784.1.p1 GENE.GFKZ01014784.1~~GFKZ01014784.1.p1  ORF type:complete len:486 (-),score=58.27 GFKZ01014784.1:617-1903(-)